MLCDGCTCVRVDMACVEDDDFAVLQRTNGLAMSGVLRDTRAQMRLTLREPWQCTELDCARG